jgi:hypothetical protein
MRDDKRVAPATPGYTSTPQLKKLGLVPGARWAVEARPDGWAFETEPDPADRGEVAGPVDVLLAFVRVAAELPPLIERAERAIYPSGALWIAWPRKAGGHRSDITDGVVREAALARSLVDIKVAAIDADWSGLKLVWRVSSRS